MWREGEGRWSDELLKEGEIGRMQVGAAGGGMECYGWKGFERREGKRKGGVETVKKKGLEETKEK